ncbi:GTP 3',8-cyclase MoaA [Ignicoccus hospitalis]|uniref:Probable GTP 3',8-cyclase n=1 Tax=Ignicoccus hospitalis (strain KIN4/I / DSM 18386 / JCM 14125) TaxID=453591 RepID=A8AAC8_IGNH4|nr:GTP 3',8-cyclase MoaA [Ignicoccus hospitalis]ABU81880.1 Radical SAM domain protein [Ignicoccus hospitalis KIN4/I]HIH89962.1 GTP 3',8-cyclase MoaA [Desulfurococcaceae archaeon]
MIRDAYGRSLATLRVSVTERCNFNCIFCHSEGAGRGSFDELSVNDYDMIAEATSRLGLKYVKFTGGEPLLRSDLEEIIHSFKEHGFEEISITTNGFLLPERTEGLKEAGVSWINVSLHSLKRQRFRRITGVDALNRVLNGIEKALENGIEVRVNVVVLRGINEDEVEEIVKYAIGKGASVHVIELHPVGNGAHIFRERHSREPIERLKKWLEEVADKKEVRELHNRPRYYLGKNFVELIEPVGNPYFCAGCTRLRLSADGKFYPCINVYQTHFDASRVLRSGESREIKIMKIIEGILELNDKRRPYYMWNLDFEAKGLMVKKGIQVGRIGLPKRAKLQFRSARVREGRPLEA